MNLNKWQVAASSSQCPGGIHFWTFAGRPPEGFTFDGWLCQCGQQRYKSETCPTCGHVNGRGVPIGDK